MLAMRSRMRPWPSNSQFSLRGCQKKANQSPFDRGCRNLGYAELPPLLKSCGAVEFEIASS